MKTAFNIPAINNELEALAKSLGIADDNDQERSHIETLGKQGGISRFKYNADLYLVARPQLLTGVKTTHSFNSNLYAIQKAENN